MITLFLGVSAVVAVVVTAWLERPAAVAPHDPVDPSAPKITDVPLLDEHGATSLAAVAGEWAVVFFGYTSCPDVCPTSLAYLAKELQALGPHQTRARGVFVSVDPARDEPAAAARYVRFFDPRFLAVTGTEESLQTLAKLLGAYAKREEAETSAAGYLVAHSSAFFILDPMGRYIKAIAAPHERGAVAKELQRLMGVSTH